MQQYTGDANVPVNVSHTPQLVYESAAVLSQPVNATFVWGPGVNTRRLKLSEATVSAPVGNENTHTHTQMHEKWPQFLIDRLPSQGKYAEFLSFLLRG